MRTIIIEIQTDSDDDIKTIMQNVEQELNCCSTWFDLETMKVSEKY